MMYSETLDFPLADSVHWQGLLGQPIALKRLFYSLQSQNVRSVDIVKILANLSNKTVTCEQGS